MFLHSDLGILAQTNNFTQWHYRSTIDDIPMIMREGYFDQAASQLKENDLIIVNPMGGGVKFLIVLQHYNYQLKTIMQS